jgi:rifampicin phosphotransferase
MNTVVHFEEADKRLVSLVGGKGSNLMTLTEAGFPVPPGFVVTAAAYDEFLSHFEGLEQALAELAFDRPDELREQCQRLRARLERLPLPASTEIAAALEKFPADVAFAVRSSSTFEDLAQAAFAGQHDTYLNIRGKKAIVERVRDCFISLWQDRAVAYRQRQGFSQKEARMAVVVQRQIECERAGVGFSIQPVTGRLDRLVIDANYGLGESVVGGECEVDHFELDKTSLAIEERVIGHKEKMIVPTADGVAEQPVPPDQADVPCMTDDKIQAVAQLLKQVEAHYGWPQDIEWGIQGGQLYLFQARPVTTIQPRWTRDESAERFPGPMTPLSWDFLSAAFRKSMAHSLALMGLPPLQGDWFQWFDHYVYGNQNAVALIASYRPLRARTPQELVAEIPALRQRYGWVLELPVVWARDLDRYLLRMGQLASVNLDGLGIPATLAHMDRVLEVASEYFLPNIAISMTQAFLHRLLHALVAMVVGPEKSLTVVDGLLAGCETKTAVVNRELHELAQVASGRRPACGEALTSLGGEEFRRQGKLADFPDFAARFQRFLEDHGHREMDMDYYHATWSERPEIVLDAVTLILRGKAEDPGETARKLRLRFGETELQFLAQVPEPLRFFFREMIRMARTYTVLDDMEHYQTTRVNPLARRAALALGRKLQERGILDAPDDVFFLRKTDLAELAQTFPHENREALRRKAAEGKQAYQAALHRSPPWALVDTAPAPAQGEGQGAVLRGLPGSPGRVTGPCFCLTGHSDFGRFPKGAIIVARTTNPAWTPLFYSAAGLITESGGPLSHGAVTAREMGLPAVMSVREVTSRLKDGQVVTVDGTQGVVSLDKQI